MPYRRPARYHGGASRHSNVSLGRCHRQRPSIEPLNLRRGEMRHGSFTASMACLTCSSVMNAGSGPRGHTSRRLVHRGEHGSLSSSAGRLPPVSMSHKIAKQLDELYPPSTCKESCSVLGGIVDAIERHIFHVEPSGNVKIATKHLHIGECPGVPESMATFALKRSGSFLWLGESDDQSDDSTGVAPRRGYSFKYRTTPDLLHYEKSARVDVAPKEAKGDSGDNETNLKNHNVLASATEKTCRDPTVVALSVIENASGSAADFSTSAVDVRRMKKTLLWHRIMRKLRLS